MNDKEIHSIHLLRDHVQERLFPPLFQILSISAFRVNQIHPRSLFGPKEKGGCVETNIAFE